MDLSNRLRSGVIPGKDVALAEHPEGAVQK